MASAEARLLASVQGARFPDGTSADVELYASTAPAEERRTFAAMVFLRDAAGDLAVLHSTRRDEWGAPGGWREPGESVRENAVREVEEETGIRLDPESLDPIGFEVFHRHAEGGLWRPGQDVLQSFTVRLSERAPRLAPLLDDASGQEWVTPAEFARRCSHLFWWPIAEVVLRPAGPAHA